MDELGPSLLNALQEMTMSFPDAPTSRRDLIREDSPLLNGYSLNFVIQILQNCGIVYLDVSEVLHKTDLGRGLNAYKQPHMNRAIILLLIEKYKPAWAKLIPRGRRECLPNLPSRVAQCLTEAELDVAPPNNEVRDWWQKASRLARYIGNNVAAEVGDKGEQYSLRLERERVGSEPQHTSLETTWAGYDILSVINSGSKVVLPIEVKASTLKKNDAYFFVTSNEWRVAKSAENYLFHLWLISEKLSPRVARVTASEVETHVPNNKGDGKWESTKIPFRLFDFEEIKGWAGT